MCAGDQGHFYAYRDAVYAHQPAEATDFFQSPARLIQIAREIPGLDTPAFEKCVDDQPYAAAISRNYDTAANTAHCQGMPCVNADGRQWTNSVLQGQSLGAAADKWLNQIIMSHQRTS